MTEEENTVEVTIEKNSLKEAIVVMVLSTVAGVLADVAVQKGVKAWKTRRANQTTVAVVEQ